MQMGTNFNAKLLLLASKKYHEENHESKTSLLIFPDHLGKTQLVLNKDLGPIELAFKLTFTLLLTNCEVHMGKHSDQSFKVWTE